MAASLRPCYGRPTPDRHPRYRVTTVELQSVYGAPMAARLRRYGVPKPERHCRNGVPTLNGNSCPACTHLSASPAMACPHFTISLAMTSVTLLGVPTESRLTSWVGGSVLSDLRGELADASERMRRFHRSSTRRKTNSSWLCQILAGYEASSR